MRISTVRFANIDSIAAGQFFLMEGIIYQKVDWNKAHQFRSFGWGPERKLLGDETVQPVDITGGKTQRDLIEV
jgi:hypothetical protein